MSDWRDMIPAPLAAPETAERRAARLRVIAGFVVFAASLRALIGSLALPLLVATATFVAVQGWLWVQEKTAADDAWLFRDSDDAA